MVSGFKKIVIGLLAVGTLSWCWPRITVIPQIKNKIKARYTTDIHNKHKQEVAYVRRADDICPEEKEWYNHRLPKVKKALEKKLNRSLDNCHIPVIALVGCGGGYRSGIMIAGCLAGAHEIGLANVFTYFSSLSGSSWTVNCWINSGLPIEQFNEQFLQKVGKGLSHVTLQEARLIGNTLFKKWCYNQPLTIVDCYGALLANVLLAEYENKRHDILLSDQADKIKSGDYPLPIYTVGIYDEQGNQEWAHVTPFEFGSNWLGYFIPTWSLGRQFENGISISYAPEQGLGFYLGTFGSGFATTANRIYKEIQDRFHIHNGIIEKILNKVGKKRISSAAVYNFTKGMESSPLKKADLIHLADAGLDFNVAYPGLDSNSGRPVDIIIVFDTSRTIIDGFHLKKMEAYAKKHNCKLPHIDYTGIEKREVTVFKDEQNLTVPVVIYIPRIKDETHWNELKTLPSYAGYQEYLDVVDTQPLDNTFARTTNFAYTPAQAKQLCALGEYKIKSAEKEIIDAINWVIDAKTN